MDTLLQDLRYAVRSLLRSPGFTAAAILTLALGIGANIATFGAVDRLFFRTPAHVVDPSRVVRLNVQRVIPSVGLVAGGIGNYPLFADIRDHIAGFSEVGAYFYYGGPSILDAGGHTTRITTELATASFFRVLEVRATLGRFFSGDEDQVGAAPVAVLSYEFWRQEFGTDPAIVGKAITIGRRDYTVVGVAPERFAGVGLAGADVWLPLNVALPDVMGARILTCTSCDWPLEAIARLAPGATTSRAAAEATNLLHHEPDVAGDSAATISLNALRGALARRMPDTTTLATWLAAVSAIVLLVALSLIHI